MPTLQNMTDAAWMWLLNVSPSVLGENVTARGHFHSPPCADIDFDSEVMHGVESLTIGSAEFIGIDPATCIGYFHLVGMVCNVVFATYNFVCVSCNVPSFNSRTRTGGMQSSPMPVGIHDGGPGSDTRTIDGAAIIPHTGFPVAAGVLVGTETYRVVAAGDAGTLDLAGAIGACGLAGINLCTGGPADIHITVRPR